MLKGKAQKKQDALQPGSVLMAKPFWADDRYQKSVILLTEHSPEGSAGVIINKNTHTTLQLDMNDINISFPVYYGGPMHKKKIVSLHNKPQLRGSEPIAGSISIGSGYDVIQEIASHHNHLDLHRVRFFSGYVTWAGGQLESEIKKGRWWTSRLNAKELFDISADTLWSQKLISDGHLYGLFLGVPEPSLN